MSGIAYPKPTEDLPIFDDSVFLATGEGIGPTGPQGPIGPTGAFSAGGDIVCNTLTTTSTTSGSIQTSSDILINGIRAGKGNSTDITCSAFGRDALFTLSTIDTDNNNSAFGRNALKLFNRTNSGTSFAGNNTAIGTFSLGNITTGFRNTGCGTYALGNITGGGVLPLSTGLRNTACGYAAGYNLSSAASDNTFVGCIRDLSSYTTGSNNTLIGSQIIFGAGGTAVNSGVGGSTALGAFTSFANFSNTTVIGGGTSTGSPGAVATAANQIMLGRATETVICPGTASNNSITLSGGITLQTAYPVVLSANQLGFRLTNTPTATILSGSGSQSAQGTLVLPEGTWLLSYSVELTNTNAITTTSVISFYTTLSTQTTFSNRLPNTGTIRIHTPNTFNIGDVSIYSGSATYVSSPAVSVVLRASIFYTGGTLTSFSYFSATRMA